MRILIAGCGEVGCRVGLKLAGLGHQVYGLRRDTSTIPSPIVPIALDLSRPINKHLLPVDIDQVIYILSANAFNEAAYQQAYVDGVKHLIGGLDSANNIPERFIFVSSTSVYGQHQGEWVDEGSETRPTGFNGQVMLEAEQQVMRLPGSTIVRFSGIYGPGRNRMINQVKNGQLAPIEPVIYSNRIHASDCARVLCHLSHYVQLNHNLILASDHQPVTLYELQGWLADQMGMPKQDRQYKPIVRRAGSKRICNKRLLELGFEFRYPDYKSGYSQVLNL